MILDDNNLKQQQNKTKENKTETIQKTSIYSYKLNLATYILIHYLILLT